MDYTSDSLKEDNLYYINGYIQSDKSRIGKESETRNTIFALKDNNRTIIFAIFAIQ